MLSSKKAATTGRGRVGRAVRYEKGKQNEDVRQPSAPEKFFLARMQVRSEHAGRNRGCRQVREFGVPRGSINQLK